MRIESKKDYKKFVLQDKLVNEFNNRSLTEKIKQFFFQNNIEKFLKLLRKYEYLYNTRNHYKIVKYYKLYWVIRKFKRVSLKLGFTIPINTFGAGLSIPHYGTIIVNKNTEVGCNCRINACVNIGASAGNKDAPKLGDNVYIGPGAILFGKIEIADNITIGANSTVNKSCLEEGAVIAGTPAKIIKNNFPNWLANNRIYL